VVSVGAVVAVVTAGELSAVVGAVVFGLGAGGTLSFGIVVSGTSAVTGARAGAPASAGERPVGVLAGAGFVLVVEPIANAAAKGSSAAAARPNHRQRMADVPETAPISFLAAAPASIGYIPRSDLSINRKPQVWQ
jgi:hypothetical protein